MAAKGKKGGGAKAKAANGHAAEEKETRRKDPAGMGHNRTQLLKDAGPIVKEYVKKMRELGSLGGEIRNEIKGTIERGADKLGCSRKMLRTALSRHWKKIKDEEMEAGLEAVERDDLETLEDLFGEFKDTDLAQAAIRAARKSQAKTPEAGEGASA